MDCHPSTSLFPMMADCELAELARDISEHGLIEPVVTLAGQVLDGRNRLRACELASVEPRFEEWTGAGSPTAWVISKNLHRRHLSESQRAMIAARLANLTNGQRASQICEGVPQQEAARLLNVSPRSVSDAHRVVARGVPELVGAVERDEIAVSAAAGSSVCFSARGTTPSRLALTAWPGGGGSGRHRRRDDARHLGRRHSCGILPDPFSEGHGAGQGRRR